MAALRKTRLHDEKGNLAAPGEVARLPLICVEAAARRLLGRRPARPLLCHSATRRIASLLTRSSRVIEFGSGASTLWLAQRTGNLLSYETDERWYESVSASLRRHNITNTVILLWDGEDLSPPDAPPDLIIIDGHRRDLCADFATRVAGPNTYIFLDNSDKDMTPPDPDREMRRSERILLDFATRTGRPVDYFTGFAPAQLYAEQGMLIALPGCP